jgi:hypothetical protein
MAEAVVAPDVATFRSMAAAYVVEPQLQLQLQLFALCMSCLKRVRRRMAAEAGVALLCQSVLGTVVDVCKVACGMVKAIHLSSRRRSSSSSMVSTAEAAAPWAVVLTACMLLAGDAFDSIALWKAADCSVRHAVCAGHQAAACSDSLVHIGAYVECHLASAAVSQHNACCSKVLGQLMQTVQTSAECEEEAARCSGGGAAAVPAAVKVVSLVAYVRKAVQEDGLVEELQAHARFVSGLLPLLHACNNPDCVSVEQCSELQLVAGKGSRCSGCKVAR